MIKFASRISWLSKLVPCEEALRAQPKASSPKKPRINSSQTYLILAIFSSLDYGKKTISLSVLIIVLPLNSTRSVLQNEMQSVASKTSGASKGSVALKTGIISKAFIILSFIGIIEAFYHASLENAFTTNIFVVHYSPFASFSGVPYWLFGVVWFPLIFLVGLWTTGLGRRSLRIELLILLTIGNVFTAYLWYLDIFVVEAYTLLYIALYATNYALTGLVAIQNWSSDITHGYVYGTATGAVVGLLFGPYGVVACGIAGGMFGAVRNFVIPKQASAPESRQISKEHLQEEKITLEMRLKEIEAKLAESSD